MSDSYTTNVHAAAQVEYWRALDEDDDRMTRREAEEDAR